MKKLRSKEEVQNAIQAIKKELVKGEPYSIMIHYTTIIDGLSEALLRRGVMKREMEFRKGSQWTYK